MSTIGSLAGGFLGGPAGAAIGSKAGDLLSTITGFGDYEINENSLAKGQTIPSFRLSSDGVEIAHREFIADVVGSTAFVNKAYDVNPGLAASFPWLSQVAVNFEEYEMLGLVYEYRPSSGSAISSTSSALGVVVLATDYNVLKPNFLTKQQMESYEFSSSTVPFNGICHPVECAPRSNVLDTMYVRNSAVPVGADQRMYDLGSFQIATQGMQSSYTVGELWVSYHLKLKKPRIAFDNNAEWAHIVESPGASGSFSQPLGTAGGALRTSSNLLGVALLGPSSFQLRVPGVYLISMNFASGNSNLAGAPTLTLGANVFTNSQIFTNNTAVAINGVSSTRAFFTAAVTVSAYGEAALNTITIGGLTAGTSVLTDILITEIPALID